MRTKLSLKPPSEIPVVSVVDLSSINGLPMISPNAIHPARFRPKERQSESVKAMNISRWFFSLLLLSLAGCANIGRPPAAKVADQIVELKILEVLTASDGHATSRAYVMNWNGQEIAARAPSLGVNYMAGDSVSVRVQHRTSSRGWRNDYRLLEFEPVVTAAAAPVESPPANPRSFEDFRRLNLNEPVRLKVLQVFSAQDGEAVFRAYRVNWGGLEVVAWDALARSNYKTGDRIWVRLNRSPPPEAKGAQLELLFSVTGPELAAEPDTSRPLLSEAPIGSMGPLP